MGSRGFTTMSFLLFAGMMMTTLTVFAAAYAGTISSVENMKLPTGENTSDSKQIYVVSMDLGSNNPWVWTSLTLNGVEFQIAGVHYNGYHGDCEANFYVDFPLEPENELGHGGTVGPYWLNRVWPAPSVAVENGIFSDTPTVRLYIPYSWLRRAGVRPNWPDRLDATFDIAIAYGRDDLPALELFDNIYASGLVRGFTNHWQTMGEAIADAASSVLTWIPRQIFGAVFGANGTAFVSTLGDVLTMNFPGVPSAIQVMVAIPMLFIVTYIVLMVIRMFIPFLPGGGGAG
jgi:hypothetical protein